DARGPQHQNLPGARRRKGRAAADIEPSVGIRSGAVALARTSTSSGRKAPVRLLMGPGLDAFEGEIVGVGHRPLHRILRLDYLVGNALALAIGDRFFLGV